MAEMTLNQTTDEVVDAISSLRHSELGAQSLAIGHS
jgi:hypothetical protein